MGLEILNNDNYPAFLAEFIGVYVLASVVGYVTLVDAVTTFDGLAIGLALVVLIYVLASVSGAHLNPAVTVGITASGKMGQSHVRSDALSGDLAGQVQLAVCYIVFQIAGAYCGGLATQAFFEGNGATMTHYGPADAEDATMTKARYLEFIFTFVVVFAHVNVACSAASAGNQYYGLAVGLAYLAGVVAIGGITGGSLNPALAGGMNNAFYTENAMNHSLHLGITQLIAGAAAALVWRAVRGEGIAVPENVQKLLGEFFGAFIIVFAYATCAITANANLAFVMGGAIAATVYAIGNVSGGHFNPAVTLALMLGVGGEKKMALKDALQYMLAQIGGGVVACLAYSFVYDAAFTSAGPNVSYDWYRVIVAELTFTCLLCLVYLACSAQNAAAWVSDFNGLAIGFAVIAATVCCAPVSGAVMNPAIAWGTDFGNFYHNSDSFVAGATWKHALAYTLAQFLGAILSVQVFWLVRPEETDGEAAGLPAIAVQGPAANRAATKVFGGLAFAMGVMGVLTVGWQSRFHFSHTTATIPQTSEVYSGFLGQCQKTAPATEFTCFSYPELLALGVAHTAALGQTVVYTDQWCIDAADYFMPLEFLLYFAGALLLLQGVGLALDGGKYNSSLQQMRLGAILFMVGNWIVTTSYIGKVWGFGASEAGTCFGNGKVRMDLANAAGADFVSSPTIWGYCHAVGFWVAAVAYTASFIVQQPAEGGVANMAVEVEEEMESKV